MSAKAITRDIKQFAGTETGKDTVKPHAAWLRIGIVCPAVLAALVFALVLTVPAFADYEQAAEHFGQSGEAAQLHFAEAIAVNTTGAGGVQAGSFYVAGDNGRVVRYGPGGEGEEPPFEEAWGWGIGSREEGAPVEGFQRCGPALSTEPVQHTYHSCAPPPNGVDGGEQIGHFGELGSVAVDQTTGDVYVLNSTSPEERAKHLVEVFTATGTPVGEGFGEKGRESPPPSPSPSESIAEGPEKLHEFGALGIEQALAVDDTGRVFVADSDYVNIADPATGEKRVMSFEPEHPGEYEHYAYAGQSKDIVVPHSFVRFQRLAVIGGGRLVATTDSSIVEYSTSGGSIPVCTYEPHGGQVEALAANAVTGEVFYYAFGTADKVHRLGSCDATSGKFAEAQAAIMVSPRVAEMFALAVNPVLSWGAGRSPGVLYAVDPGSSGVPGVGDVFVPAKVFPPSVLSESAVGTGVSSSALRASIDPRGSATHYTFQYLTEAEYQANGGRFAGAREAPAGGGELGSGGVGVAAASVSGLAPGTAYRFRVLASSECEGEGAPACEAVGAPAVFTTYPSTVVGAADGRAYELVSPPEKVGGEVFPADPFLGSCHECKPPGGGGFSVHFPMESALDGESVAYMGYPFSAGDPVLDSYLSRRTATGWQTTVLSPALQENADAGPVALDPSLGSSLVYQGRQTQLSPDAPLGYQDLYLESTGDPGVFTPLLTRAMFEAHPPKRSAENFEFLEGTASGIPVLLHSADLSHVLFAANDVLTGLTAFAPEPADPGQGGRDLYEWHGGSLSLVNVLPGNTGVGVGAVFASNSADNHAVSVDGSRVFWSAEGHLYVRAEGQRTVEVPDGSGFVSASADGSRVLLADGKLFELTQAGTPAEAYIEMADLTEGQGGFKGVAGTGEEAGDLSRIYFVDTAALAGVGENERHESAQAGGDNLYLWQEGAPPRYIATLSAGDEAEGTWAASPAHRTAEASPDGRYLAFMSSAPLTGYDSDGPPACGGACKEVFLYDATAGRLSCASCDPTGELPLGPSTLRRIQGSPEGLPQPRYLTDEGRLYFDSQDRLSPFDTNGNIEDVYEYEPERGPGEPAGETCERVGGCVLLVSPGTGSVDSNFLAMDETGKNVFFTTRERLVGQDSDELIDVYDAREEGGFPTATETKHTGCQGETCQSTPTPPVFTPPGSTAFSGLGNFLPTMTPATEPKAKKVVLTGTERLAKALKVCREKHVKRKRVACERQARRANTKTKTKKHGGAK